jgi:hypothetical protein
MKLVCALPQEIEAFEMSFEGRNYLVIEAAAFGGLFRPKAEEPQKRSPKAAKAAQVARPAAQPKSEPAQPAHGSARACVLEALRKRPMSSGEMIEALKGKTTAQSIYVALSAMRKDGSVSTHEDEKDAVRRNYLNPPA